MKYLFLSAEQNCLSKVLDSTVTLSTKWFYLGLALGLSHGTLRDIEYNHKDTQRCLTEVINAWLQKKDESRPSWQQLAVALCSRSVDRLDVATIVAAEHPSGSQ